jgi:hypothetical protein
MTEELKRAIIYFLAGYGSMSILIDVIRLIWALRRADR